MVINFVFAYVVYKFSGEAPQEIQQLVEDIRYPKGAGDANVH
jgi:cation/acetate symporter